MIWDSLSAHKSKVARMWGEAVGAEGLFLPPYSPDFKPIALAFGKLKASLRRTGARTRADVDHIITTALATITRQNAAAWFAYYHYHGAPQLL